MKPQFSLSPMIFSAIIIVVLVIALLGLNGVLGNIKMPEIATPEVKEKCDPCKEIENLKSKFKLYEKKK